MQATRVLRSAKKKNIALALNDSVRPGKRHALPDVKTGRLREQLEKLRASVRARVEHLFHNVKYA